MRRIRLLACWAAVWLSINALIGWRSLSLSSPLPPQVEPGPENWTAFFDEQRPNGQVLAAVFDSAGRLFIGGEFTAIGALPAAHIAMWDGAAWSALGDGVNNTVNALAIGPQGQLYVGGNFTQAGGLPAMYVASWSSASTWSSLGDDAPSLTVYALATDAAGALYVGGMFRKVGTAALPYLARWDGVAWSAVGGGVNGAVFALAPAGPQGMWVVGQFSRVGGMSAKEAALWDGAAWSALGSGLSGGIPRAAVVGRDGSLWVGGKFIMAGDSPASGLAWWGGGQWHVVETGPNCCLNTLALAADAAGYIYAGGDYVIPAGTPDYLYRWNGTQLRAMPANPSVSVSALAAHRGHLVVGGAVASDAAALLRHWVSGDGVCGLADGQTAALYPGDQPVTVTIEQQGDLDCLSIQRVRADHPSAGDREQTGQFWSLRTANAAGAAAQYYHLSLTLPFASAGEQDQVCGFTGGEWDCAVDSFTLGSSLTRHGITSLSDWLVRDVDPTAVSAAGLSALALPHGRAALAWDTESEIDIAAFNLYESSTGALAPPATAAQRLNAAPIPAQTPGSMWGAHYQMEITPGACRPACWYWLEVQHRSTPSAWLGPLAARWEQRLFIPLAFR